MNPLISLIIPVYNVEKYLTKCMNSVLAQTYDNYEIILVDDGSTDNSGRMCDEYARQNERVKVFHKPNGGASEARNFGIERANGNLISFVDADDYVTADYLEYLWYLMEKYDADISIGQLIRIDEACTNKIIKFQYKDVCLNTEGGLKQLSIGKNINPMSCAKLYRKKLFSNIEFPIGKYYEDVAIMYKLLFKTQKVAVGQKNIYLYVQRNSSSLHGTVSERHMYGLEAAENMCDFIGLKFKGLENTAHIRCCTTAIDIIIRIITNTVPQRNYYTIARDYLERHYCFARHSNEAGIKFKLDCICYKSGYLVAKIYYFIRCSASKIVKGNK